MGPVLLASSSQPAAQPGFFQRWVVRPLQGCQNAACQWMAGRVGAASSISLAARSQADHAAYTTRQWTGNRMAQIRDAALARGSDWLSAGGKMARALPGQIASRAKDVAKRTGFDQRHIYRLGQYWNAQEVESPEASLIKIVDCAQKGFEQAEVQGIEAPSILPELQAEIEQLGQGNLPNPPQPPAAVASPAKPISNDPEVLLAPSLQKQVETCNWPEKVQEAKAKLIRQLSAFAALYKMRSTCGIEEENTLNLMQLVRQATEGNNPPSVWTVFHRHYRNQISLVQKIKTAWFYFAYYQTSLLTKTVEAYVKSFIRNLTKDLTPGNPKKREEFFRGLLTHMNAFLVADLSATRHFANQIDTRTLEEHRSEAIASVYKGDLSALCAKVSAKQVDEESSPEVEFFEKWRDLPLIGRFFKWLSDAINRRIQSAMRDAILPDALREAVEKGLEATNALPFAIELTSKITQKLNQFRQEKIESGKLFDGNPAPKLPGTELLPTVMRNLQLVVALEHLGTHMELRKKLDEISKDDKWFLDKIIETGLESGIIKGGHALFETLDQMVDSQELLFLLLKVASEPFSTPNLRDPATLRSQYAEKTKELDTLAKQIIDQTVPMVVNHEISPEDSQRAKETANYAFEIFRKETSLILGRLETLCQTMAQKITEAAAQPNDQNHIQIEIVQFHEVLQFLASQRELLNQLEQFGEAQRKAVLRVLTPFYTKAVKIAEDLLKLQEAQSQHLRHVAVEQSLRALGSEAMMLDLQKNFPDNPIAFQAQLTQGLRHHLNVIITALAATPERLREHVDQICLEIDGMAREETFLQAMHQLSLLPDVQVAPNQDPGCLDQLLTYERGMAPRNFKRQAYLNKISPALKLLPEGEKRELEQLIGNGKNLRIKWDQIKALLQRFYAGHIQERNRHQAALNAILPVFKNWVDDKAQKYMVEKDGNIFQMKETSARLFQGVVFLREQLAQAQLEHLPTREQALKQLISHPVEGPVTGALIGLGLTLALGPAGAALATAAYQIGSRLSDLQKGDKGAVGEVAYAAGKGALIASINPLAGALAGATGAGYAASKYKEVAHNLAVPPARDKVQALCTNAFKFVHTPRVREALITRTLVALS